METTEMTPAARPGFGARAASALAYWEPRRPIYNGVMALVVVVDIAAGWPASRTWLTTDSLLGMFLMAVLANVAYCAAYAVDMFAQFSDLRETWLKRRWIVLLTGSLFAAAITHFIILGMGPVTS
jgi:hypothetical protein